MWPFSGKIRIRMERLWGGFAVLLVLYATKLNAASSSSVTSKSFASSVLPSISTSTLSSRIQSITSNTNGGFSTAEVSSKYGNNTTSSVQPAAISSISSQSVDASQTNKDVFYSTVSSNYSMNTSSLSSLNIKSSSTFILSDMRTSAVSSQQPQASEMSPSLQQGNTSASTSYLTSVVSSAVNLSNVVSATRTLLTQSLSAIGKSIFSQSKLSHTLTVNGSLTGLPSPSIAGSSTSPLENSLMVSSSSVVVATNRTLATSPLTSSMLAKASTTASESLSTAGMSLTILSSRISKSVFNSSAHSLNATVTPTTVPMIEKTISATYTEDFTPIPTLRSSSSVVNFTLQSSSFSSSTGLVVSQTRAVADSSAVLPSLSVPSRSVFSVSAVNTSNLLPSATVSLQTSPAPSLSSVSVGVKSSKFTALGEESSFMMSQNATSQSILATVSGLIGVSSSLAASKTATMQLSTSVSLHSSTVTTPSGTFSPGVVSSLATASGKESIPLSSAVLLSSQLVLSVASSSSATGASLSLTATATGESSSSAPSVVSSRFVFSQNATSQSSSTGGFSLTSQMVTPSRPSAATVISPEASVTPNKTSTDEGFIVTSYSTPCYIYYVVEKTVFPVATANHSAALSTSTTPKITLDIANSSRTQSGLPSVTLTHTIAMTTQVSETQSQVVGSTAALTSSTSLLRVSANSEEITPYSTLKRVSSKASVVSSEAVTETMVTATNKAEQTDIVSVVSVTPSVVSSEAVTETMITATNKAEQTDSVSVVSVTPSLSSSILGDSDVSTFQTGILSTQVQSTTSLSGTLAIPPVTSSVLQLQSTSQKSKALVASTMMMSGSFTPIVASASVSEMQNVTTPFITATSSSIIIQATTEHESLKSTPRSSSVMSQSSTQSTAFAITVAGSLPSQRVSSTVAISSVSLVISSDRKPVNTQAPDESILPTKSASIVQSVVSSSVKSVKQSQNSSVVQSSSMALVDSSASSAEMLSSTNIRASPITSLVTAIPSTVVAKGSVVSTQVGSSREVASSSSPSIKDDKTDSTMVETLTSSGIYQSSYTTPSVKQQESLVGTASSLTSPSTQVAALSSFSQAENKTSASSTQSFSSTGISMPSSVTHSSVVLSLSATPSKTSVISVPVSSSIHVTRSISFSQADSKSSAVEHLTSSSVSLEAASSVSSPAKRRRKKRAVGDTTSTGLSGGTVPSASQSSNVVASIEPSSAKATYTHSPVLTSVLSSSGSLESASGFPSSQTVSASVSSPKGTASYSMSQGKSTSTVLISSGSPSTSSVSEPNLTVNSTGVSSAVVLATRSATSSFHLSPSQQANVTTNHTEPFTRFSSSATLNVNLTTSGTLTQSHSVLVSSSSNETSLTQASETVKITTAHANLSVTNVVNTMTPSPTSVVLSTEGPSPSTLSLDIVTSSVLLGNSTSSLTQSVLSESSRVQSSSVGVVIPSTFTDNRTLPSTSSPDLKQSASIVLGNSSLTLALATPSASSSAQISSVGVVISSMSVVNASLPSTSSPDLKQSASIVLGNSSSTLALAASSASSSVQISSVGVVISSMSVVNASTSPLDVKPSTSAMLGNSTSTLFHAVTSVTTGVRSSLAGVVVSFTVAENRTSPSTSSQDLMFSSAILSDSASSLAQSSTSMNQASTLIGNASVTAFTSIPLPDKSSSVVIVVPSPLSISLAGGSSSVIQEPGESSMTIISSSPQPTNIRSVTPSATVSSSPLAGISVVSSTLHGSGGITSSSSSSSTAQLSSPTTNQTSQAVLSSVLARPSPSAVQSSEIQQTVVSSSRVYRPPLVTISSLGICYVVYTTRIVQPSLVSTPVVNVSSTASVNVSSTRVSSVVTQPVATTVIQVLPSASLNTSSVVVQHTLDFNATRSQFSQVLSTLIQVNVSLKASENSSSFILSSTIPVGNSTTSLPAVASSTRIVKSTEVTQSLTVSSSRIQKSVSSIAVTTVPSVIETSHLASTQVPTSQVISPTPTVSKEVSSSVTVTPTQPPDPSLLIEAIFKVPTDTDIESEEFKTGLEGKLKDAYLFAEVSRRRKKRATPEVNATIVSIQRVNNEEDVNVTFFITQDDQGVPASEAAQNYQKLSKAQLGSLTNLEVVSLPKPLVAPTTPPLPANVLVSLLIQDSASNNVSIAGNKKKLQDNLAVYYKEQKNLTTTVTASITTILHEPNNIVYLEFYISIDDQAVNASVVVETFKVPNVNLLTAKLGVQVLVQVYIPDSLTASEADYVIIGISVPESVDITDDMFRSDLADKLVKLYQKAKGQKNSRRKKRSGSTSVTVKDIVRNPSSSASEADVTFFVYDAGKVSNASYVVSIMNRLSTSDMTTVTSPYAVLSAPRQAFVPTVPTDVTPTVAAMPIKYWIIAAVLGPIALIILIILLIWWRWKKGAPKSKVEPDTIRMLETDKRKPVHGFDVARYTEEGVSGMKTTTFMSRSSATINDEEEAAAVPVKRETSLRRKVPKRPIQKPPVREQRQANPAYEEEEDEEEEEEEDDESVVSATPPRSTEALTRGRIAAKPPSVPRKTPTKPERPAEPSELDSEEDSELSEGESESEPESVPPPEQTRHSAAQVPTVAVMSEASGPPRYPPVRFRSSVHPAPSLPPLDAKHTSLVGVKVEPPSEDDSTRGRRKGKPTKRELEQRADLERQKNKQRLRDRKRNASRSPGYAVPAERKAWHKAQYDFDDVLEEEDAERVITGKKRKPRRRRPPSSSLATDEEGVPHLKSYRKLKSPKTTSSISTRDRDKKRDKSESVSNASSDESEIDMNETRRRMHAMLDDAFSLFGPQFSKKYGKEPERQPEPHPPAYPTAHPEAQPEGYPATPARQAVIPRYIGGHPALPEPPPAHGRATEPTPRQRRRVQPTIPGYPVGMPQTAIGTPGYPGRPPVRPIVTRDPIVVWDPADRQRMLSQRAPPPTYSYRDPSGQNVYITPVQQQRDDMGGLVWSPYAAEDSMDALYPDLAQASYPGALGTSPPKDTSFLSHLQAAPPHDTVLNMSASGTFDQRGASLGQSPQPLIKSIKDELFRLSQGASRKTPITEL